jgi:translation initiation factor 1 (eIF-1/SUI1)
MPDVYKLCRNNDSSIQRHIQRRHQGKQVPVIRPFNDKEENVSKARDFVKKSCAKRESKAKRENQI